MVNRGVAVWQGKVYVAAFDGILYALNAADGTVVWQVQTIDDKQRGYSVTGAPQVAGKVVVIGNGGAEFDARGYVTAYDLETGKQAWRFYTVPGDPSKPFEHPEMEMASKTWDPDSRWEFGMGGTAWDALVYDPELNLLYVGTGNAAPWNRSKRGPTVGDNLFLASILAINPDDGRLAWHYQEVPARAVGLHRHAAHHAVDAHAGWQSNARCSCTRRRTASSTCSTASPASCSLPRSSRTSPGRRMST